MRFVRAALAVFLLPVLLLATPAVGHARRRPVTVRVPAFEVAPHRNREVCTFVAVPVPRALDVGEVLISNLGGNAEFATHHMIVYQYMHDLTPLAALAGQAVDDPGCLDFGPGDPGALRIVATSQSIRRLQAMPTGTALRLEPGTMGRRKMIGLVLNSHWINASDRPQRARVTVKLVPARHVVKPLKPIFEVAANAFLKVPPGATGEVGWQWGPGFPDFGAFLGGASSPAGPACVTMLIAHTHRRGTLFTASFNDGSGGPAEEIYRNTRYADPPPLERSEHPLLVKAGQSIAYRCTHDNATDPKLGCEEHPGVSPGQSIVEALRRTFTGAAAKGCTTAGPDPAECPAADPAYPDRTFTGNCVPANLVFGFTSEDEMCILPGYYYDADPVAAPGHECDL